ncbi:hypothetical protein B2I21_35190 [Chryseobacterium mucoviscidosis]|nr:hypothetical protein B2I21_35190 [Chryseobacterium mucoviscidosis]
MPIPDLSGVPPWAEYEDLKNKINDIVAKYNNLLVNLDSLNVVSLTADHIDAGTINANVVTIRSDLAAGAFVEINGGGMRINNGSYDTFTANIGGYVTMTGALIRSKSGYPMIIMDPDNNLFGAYSSPSNYIQMVPVAVDTGSPQLKMISPVGSLSLYQQSNVSDIYAFNSELRITAQRDIILKPGLPANYIRMPFEQVLDTNKGTSLFTQLLSKASAGVSTGLSGGHNHGIADGTKLLIEGGGTVTFFAAGQHSHAQV